MKHTYHKPTHCPECDFEINMATSPGTEAPKPGDLAICAECYAVCQYGPELALLTFDTANLDPGTLAEVQRHIGALKAGKLLARDSGRAH